MKTKSYLTIGLLLLAAGLITLSTHRITAQQGHQRQPHAVIILAESQVGFEGIDRWGNGRFFQTGLGTEWIHASESAPQIPPQLTNNLSGLIAFLMDEGFSHELMGLRQHLFKR